MWSYVYRHGGPHFTVSTDTCHIRCYTFFVKLKDTQFSDSKVVECQCEIILMMVLQIDMAKVKFREREW